MSSTDAPTVPTVADDAAKQLDVAPKDDPVPDSGEGNKHPKMVSFTKLETAIKALGESKAHSPRWKETLDTLKDLQFEHIQLEEAYRQEWNEMKLRYLAKFQPLYKKRWAALTGHSNDTSPSASPTSVKKKDDDSQDVAASGTSSEMPQEAAAEESAEDTGTKHLPKFWLKAMKNHPLLEEMIEECDLPILEYLEDIRFSWVDPKDQTSFRLEFLFAKNPFFKDTMLTKTYYLEPSEDDDEESVLTRTVGTTIDWYPGKNVTEKVMVRRQRNKRTNQTRVIHDTVKVNSFFNFFKTYEIPNDDQLYGLADQDVSELEMILEAEFELGAVLRDKIIPRALGWYLGIEHDDLQSEDLDMDDFDEGDNDNDDSSESSDERDKALL